MPYADEDQQDWEELNALYLELERLRTIEQLARHIYAAHAQYKGDYHSMIRISNQHWERLGILLGESDGGD
jgi:predicted alpha-1,6-mannanase (GH76 family)